MLCGMEMWTLWLALLHGTLNWLGSRIDLGAGLSIVVLTLALRGLLLPLAWGSAYRGAIRQRKLRLLQPELAELKARHGSDPTVYLERVRALYAAHGVRLLDARALLIAIVQLPVFLGLYQVLRQGIGGARFLWVQSLAKPDLSLALLTGLTTAVLMLANPDLPPSARLVLILVPSILATLAALKFSSALAVYWTVSNCFSATQAVVLKHVVERHVRGDRAQPVAD